MILPADLYLRRASAIREPIVPAPATAKEVNVDSGIVILESGFSCRREDEEKNEIVDEVFSGTSQGTFIREGSQMPNLRTS